MKSPINGEEMKLSIEKRIINFRDLLKLTILFIYVRVVKSSLQQN